MGVSVCGFGCIYVRVSACACGTGEKNQGYARLLTANEPETVPYRAPIFSLLLASHGRISPCVTCAIVSRRE